MLEFVDIGFELIAFAQFFLDGLDLLVEIKLLLTAFHLFSHPAMNAFFKFKDVHFRLENAEKLVETICGIQGFEQFLFFLGLENHIGGNGVGIPVRFQNIGSGGHGFQGNFLV